MRCFWLGLVLALALGAGFATADPVASEPWVYHSPGDTGEKHLPAYLTHASSHTLYLWLDPGPTQTSGAVCTDALGDASCAFDVRVEARGGAQLVAFIPTDGPCGVVGCKLTSTMLRMNRILLSAPMTGPQKLGELTVDTSNLAPGEIVVTGVHSVGAARQVLDIPQNPLAYVPEPDQLVLLLSGLAGLALLHRLRGSR